MKVTLTWSGNCVKSSSSACNRGAIQIIRARSVSVFFFEGGGILASSLSQCISSNITLGSGVFCGYFSQ